MATAHSVAGATPDAVPIAEEAAVTRDIPENTQNRNPTDTLKQEKVGEESDRAKRSTQAINASPKINSAVAPSVARTVKSATTVTDVDGDKVVAETATSDSSQAEQPSATNPIEAVKEVIAKRTVVSEGETKPSTSEPQSVITPITNESADPVSTVPDPTNITEQPMEAFEAVPDVDGATFESPPESDAKSTPLPLAEDVDLSEPVITPSEPPTDAEQLATKPDNAPLASEVEVKPPLVLLGEEVAPGTSARLSWSPDQHFDGISVPTPVLVVNGTKPGMTVCLTAAVHGDELNGIEIVRRVVYDLDPKELSGAVIGVPIVNLQGFRRNSRYLPDRRDLNRFFPGNISGSSASRMAHSFFANVIRHCDALVDIHTGSFLRTNLPQLRADMSVPEVAELTEGFGATAVLHSSSTGGTLRRAAVMAGIPAVTLETGEPSRLQEDEIEHGTKGIQTLLTKLKMTRRVRVWGDPQPVYYKSVWVRADDGGLLFTSVELGQRVRQGQVLGTVTDPITNIRSELVSPLKGRVLGMALNQVVLPGFATFRIGVPSKQQEVVTPSETLPGGKLDKALPIPESIPTDVDIEDENS